MIFVFQEINFITWLLSMNISITYFQEEEKIDKMEGVVCFVLGYSQDVWGLVVEVAFSWKRSIKCD